MELLVVIRFQMAMLSLFALALPVNATLAQGGSAKEELKKRLEKIDQTDAAQVLELADWARENRLLYNARQLYEKVLEIDPGNEKAHVALDHKLVDGKWLDKDEYRRYLREKKAAGKSGKKPAEASEASSSGGSSGPPGPAELPAVEIEPFMKQHAERDKKEAEELTGELGVDMAAVSSEHFAFRHQGDLEAAKHYVTYCEQLYAALCEIFKQPLDKPVWQGHTTFYIFSDETNYLDSFRYLIPRWSSIYPDLKNESHVKSMKDTGRFGRSYATDPKKYGAFAAGFIDVPVEGFLAHNVAERFSDYFGGQHVLPGKYADQSNWIGEGIGMYMSVRYHGQNVVYCVTNAKYDGDTGKANKNEDTVYKLVCREMVEGVKEKRPFRELITKGLNDLDYIDLAKCWSLVSFLLENHQDKFIEYLKQFRKVEVLKDEKPEVSLQKHTERKLEKVFGWTPEQLDEAWAQYVLENY